MTDSKQAQKNAPLKSYVIRASRLTEAQKKALDTLWDQHVIPFEHTEIDLSSHFTQQSKLVVEIGFGMGDSLLEMASNDGETNYLGIEVHRPGVGKLLHGIDSESLQNLKIVSDDANLVIGEGLENNSIDKLLIYFPDPWHKKRHNKRRLVQPEFVQMLRSHLKLGAQIHLATDWEPYAEHMLEVMENAEGFKNSFGPGAAWENPDRPETKFERRGKRLGHGVWDFLYEKIA